MQRLDNGHGISAIPTSSLDEAYGHTAHLIQQALDFSIGSDLKDVMRRLKEGSAVLWIVEKDYQIKGIVITEVIIYPQCKALNIWLVAGEDIKEWQDCFASLEMYARHHNCKFVETTCRLGLKHVLKHLGLRDFRIVGIKELDTRTH